MKDRSVSRLGGVCSILVGISYVVIGVTELLLPPEYTAQNNARVPILFFGPNQMLLMAQWSAMAWGAVFALAVIPAISGKVQALNEGWVRWTSTLATLGFAVIIIDNYWALVVTPSIAAAYAAGNATTRIALDLPGVAQVTDAKGWLGYGAVGLWVLVVNVLALRGNVWPRLLAYLGIASAVGYFLVLASMVIPNFSSMALVVAAIGGVVIGPIWYIWMGLTLYRDNSRLVPNAQPVSLTQP
jgi:uncharacterized protein DUF4386